MRVNQRWFAIALLLIICGVLRLWGIAKPLTDKQYWRQTDTAAIARNFYDGGMKILYPQVDWRGATPGYVECEFPLYPYLVAGLYHVFGTQHESTGRFLSLLFALATVWVLYQFVLKLFDEDTAFYTALFYAVSPLVIHYTRAFMPESMLMFYYVAGIYLFYLWVQERSNSLGALALLVVSLALLTKLTALIIFIPMWGILYDQKRWSFIKDWRIWAFFCISLIAPLAWYWHAYQLFLETKLSFGIVSGVGYNKFIQTVNLFDLKMWEILLARIFINLLTPVGALACLGSVAYSFIKPAIIKEKAFLYAWLGSILLYSIVVAEGILVLEYYMIYAVPIAAIFIARGILTLKAFLATKFVSWVSYGVIVLSAILIYAHYFVWARSAYADQSYLFAESMKGKTPREALFVVVDTDGYENPAWYRRMKFRISSPSLLYYLDRKGWSLLPYELENTEPLQIEEMILQGARYFVVPEHVMDRYPKVEEWINQQQFKLLEKGGGFSLYIFEKSLALYENRKHPK